MKEGQSHSPEHPPAPPGPLVDTGQRPWTFYVLLCLFHALVALCTVIWAVQPPEATLVNLFIVIIIGYISQHVLGLAQDLIFGIVPGQLLRRYPLTLADVISKGIYGIISPEVSSVCLFGQTAVFLHMSDALSYSSIEAIKTGQLNGLIVYAFAIMVYVHFANGPSHVPIGNNPSNRDSAVRSGQHMFGSFAWYLSDGRFIYGVSLVRVKGFFGASVLITLAVNLTYATLVRLSSYQIVLIRPRANQN